MNLFDLNSDNIVMNIDGEDIEMKHPICYDKVIDKWLVSKCGKVWSNVKNRLLLGGRNYDYNFSTKRLRGIKLNLRTPIEFWEDGSGNIDQPNSNTRDITLHKMVIDTWAPLYDNPPKGISWEQWEIVRKLDTVYNHISKTVVIDHIDDNPANNHIDNLRRTTSWDNNTYRKKNGI